MRRRPHRFGFVTSGTIACLAVALVVAGVPGQSLATPKSDKATGARPGRASEDLAVKRVGPVPARKAPQAKPMSGWTPPKVAWPRAAKGVGIPNATTPTRVPGTPVWAQSLPSTKSTGATSARSAQPVEIEVLDQSVAQAAGLDGVVMKVTTPSDASAIRLGVDYSGFAGAFGGNFGARLAMGEAPGCLLTSPAKQECRLVRSLSSRNDRRSSRVTATLSEASAQTASALSAETTSTTQEPSHSGRVTRLIVVSPAVVGPTADGGSGGSYAATTLAASGSWSGGGSTGSFSYSYPIGLPPAATPLMPSVALSYNSQRVDGQNATTQPQSSWVGDGWGTPSMFVEQTFTSCADKPMGVASPKATADRCWAGNIMTLSLNGSSTALVWDATQSVWRGESDSGQLVRHLKNKNTGAPTKFADYWTVTDRAGTTYYFGLNRLPGWASGKATTNSVDYVPVYSPQPAGTGAEPDNPCYSSSGFNASVCTMAYRWNLDYVVDVHGNAMSYWYGQATNKYGQNNGATTGTYVRESYLSRIDYGFRAGGTFGTVPNQVVFSIGSRCLTASCAPLTSSTKAAWPDVPFDKICTTSTCTSKAPSFFSTLRLTGISTTQYSVADAARKTVDSWAFEHSFPATGDATSPTLWLKSITRTGAVTSALGSSSSITTPKVLFGGVALRNRVDTVADGLDPMKRQRIQTITTETGSMITVEYQVTHPCSAPVTVTPASNATSCYPVRWQPQGYSPDFLDWFQKWSVVSVTQTDVAGEGLANAPQVVTSYSYPVGPAWRFDDNEVIKPAYRTYGQFRGYGKVRTLVGDTASGPRTLQEDAFYRGMSKNNSSTVVNVTDSLGGVHEDVEQLAGLSLEQTSYLGEGGAAMASQISSYWVSAPTATRTRSGLSALTSRWVAPAKLYLKEAVTSSGSVVWRATATDTTYDSTPGSATIGLAKVTYKHSSPVNSAFDSCSTVTYATPNVSTTTEPPKNMVGLIAEQEVDAVACGGYTDSQKDSSGNVVIPASVPVSLNSLTAPASVARPDKVIDASRTFYDDETYASGWPQTTVPTRGNPTMVQVASNAQSGVFTWTTSAKRTYDAWGRQTSGTDALGRKSTTTYAMNAVGLTTSVTDTNPLSQATTVAYDTRRWQPVTTTDENGIVTTLAYDAIGRLVKAWTNNRATTLRATVEHVYQLQAGLPVAVTTNTLNESGGATTSVALYDSMLRPRQSQVQTPEGGRLVTDTFLDTRGWVASTNNGWWDPQVLPSALDLARPEKVKAQVPLQHAFTYDGLGRVILDTARKNNVDVTSTRTIYGGDRVTVIPPDGGTVTATVSDTMGRMTAMEQYTARPSVNTPLNGFTGLWTVSGGTKTTTTYGFDARGTQASVRAADGSTWTSTYDLLGRVVQQSDPDAGTSSTVYDAVGNAIQTTDARGKSVSTVYDVLNRPVATYAAPTSGQTPDKQLTALVYDNADARTGVTYPVGRLTKATRYVGGASGDSYTTTTKGFNVFGSSLGETLTLDTVEASPVEGSYTYSHIYSSNTGYVSRDTIPAAGDLPAETLTRTYTGSMNLPTGVSGYGGYAISTNYDAWGRVSLATIGGGDDELQAEVSYGYDAHTGQVLDRTVTARGAAPAILDQQSFAYNAVGGLVKAKATRLGNAAMSETQCYRHDSLQRLVEAWTANDDCATGPVVGAASSNVATGLPGVSPYWTQWTFDSSQRSQRATQIEKAITVGGADTVTSYAYDGAGAAQPHTLTSTTGGKAGSTSYRYDVAGNMTTRNASQGAQTLAYDDSGELASVTSTTKGTTSYTYGPDGALLIQKDPSTTTVYLPGQQITITNATGEKKATRYIALPGGMSAHRTATGRGYDLPGLHGTVGLTLDGAARNPVWREFTPYGEARGTQPAWFDNRAFLNQPADPDTGLTRLGARSYDPVIGQFTTLDPLLEPTLPQSLNGYSYANGNPILFSDASGLSISCTVAPDGSVPDACNDWASTRNDNGDLVDFGGAAYDESHGASGRGNPNVHAEKTRSHEPWGSNPEPKRWTGVSGSSNPRALSPQWRYYNDHPEVWCKGAWDDAICSLDNGRYYSPLALKFGGYDFADAVAQNGTSNGGGTLAVIGGAAAGRAGGRAAAAAVKGMAGAVRGRPAPRSGPLINSGKQGKHVVGHSNFIPGRSELAADANVLARRAGTGSPVGAVPRGQAGFRERVDFGEEIGTYVDKSGKRLPTTVGIIHYSKDGSIHIVPARPLP